MFSVPKVIKMNQNPYQSPEEAEPIEATAAALKPPIVLIAFQGIMVVAAVLMYLFWFPHLNDAYLTNGLGLPAISKHLLSNPFGYLTFGVLVANGLFAGMLANRRRGKLKRSRNWAVFFIVFWILFLFCSAWVAYLPVFAVRSGGINIWL